MPASPPYPAPRPAGSAAAALALTLLGLAAWVTFGVLAWPFTVDDAYIVLRYSGNLVAGHGATYNPGGPPIEGLSHVAWMLVCTLPHLLGLDAAMFAKVAGAACMLGTLVTAGLLAARAAATRGLPAGVAGGGAVLLLGCLPMTAVHAVSGLETALVAALFLLLLASLGRLVSRPERSPWPAALLALALGLSRAEGNLAALAGIAAAWLCLPRARRPALLRAALLGWLLPGAVWFALRWSYYGLPLPLPFYVKVHDPAAFGGGDQAGTAVGLDLLRYLGPWWLLPLGLGLTALSRRHVPAILATGALAATAILPAHIMGYEARYFFPVLAAAAVPAGLGIARLAAWLGHLVQGSRARMAAALLLGLVAAAPFVRSARERLLPWQRYGAGLAAVHVPLGHELARLRPLAPDPVLAIGDAGAVPYLSGWTTVDTYGLNNPALATSGRHDPADLLARDPDLLVLISEHADAFASPLPWEDELYELALQRGRRVVARLQFTPTYFLWLLCRDGSPFADALSSWRPPAALAGEPPPSDTGPPLDGATAIPLHAQFHNGLELVQAHLRDDLLAVRVRVAAPIPGDWKFFVHVHAGQDGPLVRQLDFAPVPPLHRMRPGREYLCWTTIAPALQPGEVLRLGVFDEADPELLPLADRNGQTSSWLAR